MPRPIKRIDDDALHRRFLESRTFDGLFSYVIRLNAAVLDKKTTSVSPSLVSNAVKEMVSLLRKIEGWVDEHPRENVGRVGDIAFRKWHAQLVSDGPGLMQGVLEASGAAERLGATDSSGVHAEELGAYLDTSFGNETRLDYGTGHEAGFCLLLHILDVLGVFTHDDDAAVVLVVFAAYLRVTRKLQAVYGLEPAGSHGVWGLDDYSFLPFLWGSSQLRNSTRVKPTVIGSDAELERLRADYMYLDAICVVKKNKARDPLEVSSPMLYDISKLESGWPKINQGMIKMYRGEVWNKRPVIQAFLFGQLFPFP